MYADLLESVLQLLIYSAVRASLKHMTASKFKIPLWNYNSITIIQQHLNTYAINLRTADL